MTPLDVIVIGQGLAGTALAWHLLDAGRRIVVMDEDAPASASKVSAGLFTPIMGKNFTRNDDAVIAAACAFYRSIEQRTGARFLRDIQAVRVFADVAERSRWEVRRAASEACLIDPQPAPPAPPDIVHMPHGGFVMRSAQLDTMAYLAASRAALPFVKRRVDVRVDLSNDGPFVRIGDHVSRHVVFCDGFAGAKNPYFPALSFRSAKGELLLIRLGRPFPAMSLHRRLWMAPTDQPAVFRVGATFDWTNLDHVPTPAGRAEIEAEVRAILACQFDVVAHLAGVRPIVRGGPRIGVSTIDRRIAMVNGLGTKGAMRAPLLAALLARHLNDGAPLPADVDIATLSTAVDGTSLSTAVDGSNRFA